MKAIPLTEDHPSGGTVQHISVAEFTARARAVRLVLTDNDGVLTDTGVYYSERGEELKRYSIRDGMGVERLRAAGMETGIITGELSTNLEKRARKLNIPYLYLGIKDKRAHLDLILAQTGLQLREIAFIGDDVNDLGIMEEIRPHGVVASPGDAMPVIMNFVHYVCRANGGYGAFRDFAEAILAARAME